MAELLENATTVAVAVLIAFLLAAQRSQRREQTHRDREGTADER